MLEPNETRAAALNLPQIEMCDVQSLLPYAQNARTHSLAQIEQIAASIREFGWTNPVLIDGRGGIVAGHGRVRAAQFGRIFMRFVAISRASASTCSTARAPAPGSPIFTESIPNDSIK